MFGIIKTEGGFNDAGLVIEDCLQICNNILTDSETCQRLFFAMGSDWILRLADFFDPLLLESLEKRNNNMIDYDSGDDGSNRFQTAHNNSNNSNNNECWFDDSTRLHCAILALSSLYSALSTVNASHQRQMAKSTSVVIPSAIFWIARRGPAELVNVSLSLLNRLVEGGNAEIGHYLSNSLIKVSPAIPGKNLPLGVDVPSLRFSWKPLPNDDRRFIAVLSLLAERYIYPATTTGSWNPTQGPVLSTTATIALQLQYDVLDTLSGVSSCNNNDGTGSADSNHTVAMTGVASNSFATACLSVFENILASDTTISDLIIQYILAPPPPPVVDMSSGRGSLQHQQQQHQQLESMRPLGTIVLQILVDGCHKVVEASSYSSGGGSGVGGVMLLGNSSLRNEIDITERAANLLAVVFIHGSQLARELSTAVTTGHTNILDSAVASKSNGHHSNNGSNINSNSSSGGGGSRPLLPMLLSTAGRTARIPGGAGYPLLISILRMLACITSGCEFAAKQVSHSEYKYIAL